MKRTLNANAIKTIAIIAMTIDHIAWVLYPEYEYGLIPILRLLSPAPLSSRLDPILGLI